MSGAALRFASAELRGDKDLVLAAIEGFPAALEDAAPVLQDDRMFILEAMKRNGKALDFARPEFQVDREIAWTAAQGLMVINFESQDEVLRTDKELQIAAMMEDGMALEHA